MAYQLIRITECGKVVLNEVVNAPNQLGDNSIWLQMHPKGELWLISLGSNQIWVNNPVINTFAFWVMKPEGKPLPKIIEMMQLMGTI